MERIDKYLNKVAYVITENYKTKENISKNTIKEGASILADSTYDLSMHFDILRIEKITSNLKKII